MDQSGLAERMGVHKSKLCRIELGRQTCSAEMLEAAARALGVEVGDLCAEAA
jgi:transcriptional regulator with XRE-family HTH domain